jgi:hypothetical protein
MGFLIKNLKTNSRNSLSLNDVVKGNSNEHLVSKTKLYKPLNEFNWIDADKRERKEVSIKAYKEFAF